MRTKKPKVRVSRIAKSPADLSTSHCQLNAETAEKQVAAEHKISGVLRDRLVAIRDDL